MPTPTSAPPPAPPPADPPPPHRPHPAPPRRCADRRTGTGAAPGAGDRWRDPAARQGLRACSRRPPWAGAVQIVEGLRNSALAEIPGRYNFATTLPQLALASSCRLAPFLCRTGCSLPPWRAGTAVRFRHRARGWGRGVGAGYAFSEMITARKDLWSSLKTSRRANHDGEPGPIAVQIAGTDAALMDGAALYNIERGAQIIDINMGCPAKKVCRQWAAGSALMQDEALAVAIARAVVAACAPHRVPVTLKMRTGWCPQHKNAPQLARPVASVGIQMLTVHGRTREQGYGGQAEYETIAAVKAAVGVPVVANGDITTPEKARAVLAATGADAIMIGRAAQGRPWIFREVGHFLATGEHLAPPLVAELRRLLLAHVHHD